MTTTEQQTRAAQPADAPRVYGHHIGGRELQPAEDLIHRRAPGTGEVVASWSAGTAADTEMAIAAARAAFDAGTWSGLPGVERGRILLRVAELMRADADRLARIEADESGKPLVLAAGDVAGSIDLFEYAAAVTMTSTGEAHTNLGEDFTAWVVREPAGVVAMIIPWNFPLLLLAQKLPFALGAGCTAVVKPSEFTSGTALELMRILREAGVPDGVVNVVTGTGPATGQILAESQDVDLLSFTGSTATGQAITAASAGSIKRLSLELGGKAASIVFADADLDDALDGVLFGVFFNQGECCVSGARLLVQESIADDFVAKLVSATQRIVVGAPLTPGSELGAMISPEHLQTVLGHIQRAEEQGARVVAGGHRLTTGELAAGDFVAPTIIDGVAPDHAAFREEIFGPVLTVTRFRDLPEAVDLANATPYGLAGSVWTKDIDKALDTARQVRVGRMWINTTIDGAPSLPAGGMKQSGYGREMGRAGFDEFTEIKTVQVRTGPRSRVFGGWTA
ncbi:Acyl-CoA reductase [Klenkia soli]|uniref:Acyl-CoA reductase n=1 Tax=Klenkia soli TaxID=1052260 RepID=A0A1H0G4T1_9ACTN|nr:aldehyde dehydrogenase family protein [Klenkia soli]SDO01908.1 Acyl-CoA reductase [Klenkia soli]